MDAGKLNRQVHVQSLQSGQDDLGQPVTTWTTVCTVRADVRHLSGLETIKSGADTSIVKASIRIRYRADVTATMRVLVGSKAYEIKGVLPDVSGRQFVDLACEMVNGG